MSDRFHTATEKYNPPAPGETAINLTSGPKARPRLIVIVSKAALEAQYAILDPDPVNELIEETFTTTASPVAFNNGAKALIVE
jgi:hypothetical protein